MDSDSGKSARSKRKRSRKGQRKAPLKPLNRIECSAETKAYTDSELQPLTALLGTELKSGSSTQPCSGREQQQLSPLPPQTVSNGTRGKVGREKAVDAVIIPRAVTPSDGPSILLSPGPWSPPEQSISVGNGDGAHKTPLRIILLASVAVVMLSLVAAVAMLVRHNPVAQTCSSSACNYYATLLRDALNESVQPCEDLYQHVCSRWDAQRSYSVRTSVYYEYMATLASNLEVMVVPQTGRTPIQEVAVFYRSCIEVFNGAKDNTDEAKDLLQKFGISWPVVSEASNVFRILFSMSAALYCGSVLRFEVSALSKRITITPAPLFQFLTERHDKPSQKGWDEVRYRRLFEAMVEAFALQQAGRPVSYEEHVEIENVFWLPLNKAFTAPSWKSVQNATLDHVVGLTLAAKERTYWEEELSAAFNDSIDASYMVFVENVDFFLTFFDLLRLQGEGLLSYYVGWHAAQVLALVSSANLTRHYLAAGNEDSEGYSLFCIKLTHIYMGPVLYASYAKSKISLDVFQDAEYIADNIEKAFWASVNATSWWRRASIPDNLFTARELVHYLKTAGKVGGLFPDQQTSIPQMSDDILINMREVTLRRNISSIRASVASMIENGRVSFFHFTNGTLQLHPIAFQEPFYSSEALPGIKYGTMGTEIAYALASRVFSVALPSSVEFAEGLRPRMACIYGDGLATVELDFDQIDLLERLASLRTALQAFADLQPGGGSRLRLRNYEHLSNAQLFFLFWCFAQCGMEGGKSLCNDPVRLTTGFANAFQCAKSSYLFAQKDCPTFEY